MARSFAPVLRVATLALSVAGVGCEGPPVQQAAEVALPTSASPFAELYDEGVEFSAFLAAAESRRDTWRLNYGRSELPSETLARVRALEGAWRLLVVAEDWCGDSANTIPYLARLVEASDRLEMRVVNSQVGRRLMEAHPTPDGRPATPTVLVLDESGREVGCWVERPTALQEWFLANEGRLEDEDLYDRKYSWYDWDVGEHTAADVVAVLEGAEAGNVICGSAG